MFLCHIKIIIIRWRSFPMQKRTKHNISKRILSLFLLLIFVLTSCSKSLTTAESTPLPSRYPPTPTHIKKPDNSANTENTNPTVTPSPNSFELCDFDTYMNQLFETEITSDPLLFHQRIADPESFSLDLNPPEPVLSITDANALELQRSNADQILATLKLYNYNMLTSGQQITYDIVQYHIERVLEQTNYPYYGSMLNASLGPQLQLPIVLNEYKFYKKEDIDAYLNLIKSIDDYLTKIISYEWERSNKGYFVPDSTINSIITQCTSFLDQKENNLFLTGFTKRLNNCEWLSDQEKTEYIQKNEALVKELVFPAYEKFSKSVQKLQGSGNSTGSFAEIENGTDYFELLTQIKTGTNKTMTELKKQLENALQKHMKNLVSLQESYPNLRDIYNKNPFPETDPTKVMLYLENACAENYPMTENLTYEIKNVPTELEPYFAPAFYFIPPLDHYEENLIYLNATGEDAKYIFPSLGHEGYPGHMLQNTYYLSTNPPLIRTILSNLGYEEGWGVYAELDSYRLTNMTEQEADYLISNKLVTYCLYSLLEIYIHYEGFDEQDTISFLARYGKSSESAKTIYKILLDNPCNYLPYTIGYLELSDLRTYAETRLATVFSAKEFHEFILAFGPASFPVLKKYFYQWIEEKKRNPAYHYSEMLK